MPIHRFALLLPLLALLLTTTPTFAGLTWEDRSVTVEAEPGQEVIEAAFAFENTGDDPVTVTRVTSSCGCTTPSLKQDTYAPGEGGKILAHFEIGSRTGRHNSRIIVRSAPAPAPGSSASDAGGSSTTTLTLRSEIPELVRLPARVVHWRPDEAREPKTLLLQLVHKEALGIAGVRSDSELVTASVKAMDQAPQEEAAEEQANEPEHRHYELTITPKGEPGRAEVLIEVQLPEQRRRLVKLPARVLPRSQEAQEREPDPTQPEATGPAIGAYP